MYERTLTGVRDVTVPHCGRALARLQRRSGELLLAKQVFRCSRLSADPSHCGSTDWAMACKHANEICIPKPYLAIHYIKSGLWRGAMVVESISPPTVSEVEIGGLTAEAYDLTS